MLDLEEGAVLMIFPMFTPAVITSAVRNTEVAISSFSTTPTKTRDLSRAKSSPSRTSVEQSTNTGHGPWDVVLCSLWQQENERRLENERTA